MDGKIRMICRILAACVLCLFLVQGAMAGTSHKASKAADRALFTKLKALKQKEKASKSADERTAIRAQMMELRHQARMTKRAQRSVKRGVK
jgi:hypothetical protein